VASRDRPARLQQRVVERPWGGEVWFTAEEELPLLVKFIYTHQALSFQVHPGDEYAADHHRSRGKTEMWYIVSAAPGAKIALGFRDTITRDMLREAAMSGEIEQYLNWVSPRTGDAFFTPAGAVHAIGGGIELWEIQENSDITYRLFDYGRGRELHLEHALQVTNTERSDPGPVPLPVCCKWFCTDRLTFESSIDYVPDPKRWQVLIFVKGRGALAGERFEAGQVWLVPADAARFQILGETSGELLRTWVP
jgi:mannose-6-phosphate isomerase